MTRAHIRRTPIIFAVLAVLALAAAALAPLFYSVQAQDGSVPAKPTGLSATATHDQATLTWNNPGDDSITGYTILRRNIAEQDPGEFTTVSANTGTTNASYTDVGLAAETRYAYRIVAINDQGNSTRSNYVNVETGVAPEPEPPAKPTGLSATASHDTVTLTWNNPGDDSIDGYVILRRNRDTDAQGQFTNLVNDTGSTDNAYNDDTVAAETPYTYRIKAINEHGTSERSRWLHIDTPADPSTPTPAPQQQNSDADDFADSTATTGQVAIGESIIGRIESHGDVDWILVQGDPSQWFTITVTGYGEDDHTALETPHQRAYYLLDGSVMTSEHELIQHLAPCTAGCTHVEVSQGGSRYVAVASTFEANTGSYQLTITLERAYETAELASDVSNDVDTHGFLRILTPQELPGFDPASNVIRGAIPPHDADWYRIDLAAGRAYRFALRDTESDLRLRLRDSGGTVIGSVRSDRTIHAVPCAEGSHYIEVFRPDDAPVDITNYVVDAAYTDGLATKALIGNLANAGQAQLAWQCYGTADSHQVQFQLGSQWTTLSADGNNPADIGLEYLNEGFAAKVTGLPTGDEYADYRFRITRVVDGVATTNYREVSIVVIPDTPDNLRGGWNFRHYPDALTMEWDTVAGDNVDYEVQIKDHQDDQWLALGEGLEPPTGLIHQRDGETRIKILAASPRYVSHATPWGYGSEHVLMRVRATQYGQASTWSEPFDVTFTYEGLGEAETRDGMMTAAGQATFTWGNLHYYGNSTLHPITTYVMYRMDGEWLHLLPGHEVNGVTVEVESNRAVVSGLPTGQSEYEFSIRHLGRITHPYSSTFLIMSDWSRTITITTELETLEQPEATLTGNAQVSVNWKPVADATQYRLRLWTVDRWEELDGEGDGSVTVTMSDTTANVSGLPSDYYWYIFQVRALGPNSIQQSAWSPNVAVFNQHHQGN